MRISSNTIFETGTNLMLQQQDTLIKTQQQLSTGRRVLTPADDPIAAAQALNVSQSLSLNQQYSVNRTTADSSLKLEENVLKKVTALLQDGHESAIRAGTASFTDADRVIVAKEIRSQLESLVGSKGGVSARIQITPPGPGGTSGQTTEGAWALFRLFDKARVEGLGAPEKFKVTFDVEARQASFEVTASSVQNPFRLRELAEFRCPGGL